MSQRIVSGVARRHAALCYAENTRQQDMLAEKLSTISSTDGETLYLPSYVSIVVRAIVCVVMIGGLMYGVNRAMAAWLS